MTKAYLYIVRTHDKRGCLTSKIPWRVDDLVTFGPCKPTIRKSVQKGDYIIGISSSRCKPRRILFYIKVKDKMSFRDTWEEGDTDENYRSLRASAVNPKGPIHVQPKYNEQGKSIGYEHIKGAIHEKNWKKDIEDDRDYFIIGDEKESRIFGENSPVIPLEIMIVFKNRYRHRKVDENAPFGYDKKNRVIGGRPHRMLTGKEASRIIKAIGRANLHAQVTDSERNKRRGTKLPNSCASGGI